MLLNLSSRKTNSSYFYTYNRTYDSHAKFFPFCTKLAQNNSAYHVLFEITNCMVARNRMIGNL